MPIYEYRCDNCGHELEAFQKLNESPLQTCPQCDTDNLIKKISAAGFRLKGGGWYETDFKSGNKKNVAGSDGASTKESSSGGDSSDASGAKDKTGSDSKSTTSTSASDKTSAGSGD